jgi:D-lactate dehydrogenase
MAAMLARSFGIAERGVKVSLTAGRIASAILGDSVMRGMTRGLSLVFPGFPQWHGALEKDREDVDRSLLSELDDCEYVYWPACMSRMMHGTAAALVEVSSRADVRVHIPSNAVGLCCGQAFSSKGFIASAVSKQSELVDAMWRWSDRGRRPIVTDLGSCTAFIRQGLSDLDPVRRDQLARIRLIDSSLYAEILLPKLKISKRKRSIAIHSVCSNQKFGWGDAMLTVGSACADEMIQPHEGKCCGMGGDRGFELPELVQSATATVAENMNAASCEEGYTNARSCAISLSTGSGKPWRSLMHLLRDVSE